MRAIVIGPPGSGRSAAAARLAPEALTVRAAAALRTVPWGCLAAALEQSPAEAGQHSPAGSVVLLDAGLADAQTRSWVRALSGPVVVTSTPDDAADWDGFQRHTVDLVATPSDPAGQVHWRRFGGRISWMSAVPPGGALPAWLRGQLREEVRRAPEPVVRTLQLLAVAGGPVAADLVPCAEGPLLRNEGGVVTAWPAAVLEPISADLGPERRELAAELLAAMPEPGWDDDAAVATFGRLLAAAEAPAPSASLRAAAALRLGRLDHLEQEDRSALPADLAARVALAVGGPTHLAQPSDRGAHSPWVGRVADLASGRSAPSTDPVPIDRQPSWTAVLDLLGALLECRSEEDSASDDAHWSQAIKALAEARTGPVEAAADSLRPMWLPLAAGDPLRSALQAQTALLLAEAGRSGEALALAEEIRSAARSWWDRTLADATLAQTELAAGRPRRAIAAADRIGGGTTLDRFAMAIRAWALFDLAEPAAPQPAVPQGLRAADQAWLQEARALSILGAAPGEAAQLLRDAADRWGAVHPGWRLRARWAAAEAEVRDGGAPIAMLQQLEVECEADGRWPMLARVRGSLRRLGVRRAAERAAAVGGLTGRESEVLQLVAQGCSSTQVAARLGIAASTVDTQVASALRRLGVRTRREAVRLIAAEAPA